MRIDRGTYALVSFNDTKETKAVLECDDWVGNDWYSGTVQFVDKPNAKGYARYRMILIEHILEVYPKEEFPEYYL